MLKCQTYTISMSLIKQTLHPVGMDTYIKNPETILLIDNRRLSKFKFLLTRNNKHVQFVHLYTDTQLTSPKQISLQHGSFIACTQIKNHIKRSTNIDCDAFKGRLILFHILQRRINYKSTELAFLGF